ncbi:MAG: cation transporter [Clostridiales bacterium]|nr:cation transporter [Clostridiales bacterium]
MNGRTVRAAVTLGVGLALNIALGVTKLVVGITAGSTSVTSDAINNVTDAAVSVVTLIATFLAARGADHKHPFGHGRYEYIATFVLGAVILAVGIEVFTNGLERAITPVAVDAGLAVWLALGISIAVKAFMALFYGISGKRTKSDTIKAAAVDAVSDVAVTTVVLACMLIEKFTGAYIDGYASMAVSVVIVVMAIRILISTVSVLVGERPNSALYAEVLAIVENTPEVVSAHDLIINDYGAATKIAEVDAVLPADMPFVKVHAVCDGIERRVLAATGVKLCVHADPLDGDARVTEIKRRVDAALANCGASAHDITIDDEAGTVTLDIRLADGSVHEKAVVAMAEAEVRAVTPFAVVVNVDYI